MVQRRSPFLLLNVRACAGAAMDETSRMQLVEGLFLFSMVWAVGATGDGESRAKFDTFFRTLSMGGLPPG